MPKIVNFSNAVTIGIHSLIILAREKKPLNAIKLADKMGSSKYHIGKVLQKLVKDGLLTSLRGPTGGFRINRDPGDIQIYDIYRSIEGEVAYVECPRDDHICPGDMCIRDNIIKTLTTDFVTYLKSHTVEDYI